MSCSFSSTCVSLMLGIILYVCDCAFVSAHWAGKILFKESFVFVASRVYIWSQPKCVASFRILYWTRHAMMAWYVDILFSIVYICLQRGTSLANANGRVSYMNCYESEICFVSEIMSYKHIAYERTITVTCSSKSTWVVIVGWRKGTHCCDHICNHFHIYWSLESELWADSSRFWMKFLPSWFLFQTRYFRLVQWRAGQI